MNTDNYFRRKIDFYIKGLSLEVRQELFRKLDKTNTIAVGYFLEKPEGYQNLKRLGYPEEVINTYIQCMKAVFDDVNRFMIANGRCPLFSNTEDTYISAVEYTEMTKLKPLAILEKEFGCRYQDYAPPVYTKDSSDRPL